MMESAAPPLEEVPGDFENGDGFFEYYYGNQEDYSLLAAKRRCEDDDEAVKAICDAHRDECPGWQSCEPTQKFCGAAHHTKAVGRLDHWLQDVCPVTCGVCTPEAEPTDTMEPPVSKYPDTMTGTYVVEVAGAEVTDGFLVAFVDDEVRGVVKSEIVPFGPKAGSALFMLTIHGDTDGDKIKFGWSPDGTAASLVELQDEASFPVNGNKGSAVDPK